MAPGRADNSSAARRSGPLFIAPPMWEGADYSWQALGDDERATLAAIATVVRFKKGEIIFDEGGVASAVFSIISGVIKLYRTGAARREHIARFMFQNDLAGLAEYGRY